MKGVKGDDGSGKAPQRAETGTEAAGTEGSDGRNPDGNDDLHPLDSRLRNTKIASLHCHGKPAEKSNRHDCNTEKEK